jgi:hypothetical protein
VIFHGNCCYMERSWSFFHSIALVQKFSVSNKLTLGEKKQTLLPKFLDSLKKMSASWKS